jgi:hypothetical protein
MTPERQAKIKDVRDKLKNLTPEQKQALYNRGVILTIEVRALSMHNTILLHMQAINTPSVVGGFQQWRKAGKMVKRGEHGMTIWFPIGQKNNDGDVLEATTFYTATVFDVSQVEDLQPAGNNPAPAIIPAPVIPQREPIRQAPASDPLMAGFQLV